MLQFAGFYFFKIIFKLFRRPDCVWKLKLILHNFVPWPITRFYQKITSRSHAAPLLRNTGKSFSLTERSYFLEQMRIALYSAAWPSCSSTLSITLCYTVAWMSCFAATGVIVQIRTCFYGIRKSTPPPHTHFTCCTKTFLSSFVAVKQRFLSMWKNTFLPSF